MTMLGVWDTRVGYSAARQGLWAIAMVCGCLWASAGASAKTANRIIAIVNEDVVTEAEVNAHVDALSPPGEEPGNGSADAQKMQRAAVRRLIEQRLLLQEAKKAGVSVSPEDVMQRVDALRARLESEEAFRQMLEEAGLSEEQLKEKIRDQLLVQHVVDAKVRSTITISPQEVAHELSAHPGESKSGDRVRASHILIRVDEHRSEAEARKLIGELRERLAHSEDFAELARRYSEDSHRDDGGLMGWVAQGELLPELDAVLFSMPSGVVSEPIQSRLGFHLVRVEERRTAASLSVTEANQAIYQRLYEEKFQDAFRKWLGDLRKHAYIEILDDALL